MKSITKNNLGYAAVIIVLGVITLSLIITSAITSVIISQQKIARNVLFSMQSYYTAEAGVEDVLLRIFDGEKSLPNSPHTLTVGGATATITITQDIGGNTIIESQGEQENRTRSLEVAASPNTDEADFFYGAQAGDGGFYMDNNSIVNGNVYSNGSLEGSNGATITGDVIVAGNSSGGNRIYKAAIGGNAYSPNFRDCSVAGDITYVTGGEIVSCPADGSQYQQASPIASADMPISQEQIDDWKQAAQGAGIIAAGNYTPDANTTQTIGPGVITGNMILGNNTTIILTGTVYIQGHVDIQNGSSIQLSSTYGPSSGVLLADGWIEISNNGTFSGSGQANSYVLILSTSACDGTAGGDCSSSDAAIDIHNNATGVIFYAANGLLYLHNNVNLTQGTAWKIFLDNNAIVNYEIGLQNALFSGGPGGGYSIDSWKEIQ